MAKWNPSIKYLPRRGKQGCSSRGDCGRATEPNNLWDGPRLHTREEFNHRKSTFSFCNKLCGSGRKRCYFPVLVSSVSTGPWAWRGTLETGCCCGIVCGCQYGTNLRRSIICWFLKEANNQHGQGSAERGTSALMTDLVHVAARTGTTPGHVQVPF